MQIAKNIFIVLIVTISLFFVWFQNKSKEVELLYLYDNFLYGLGDKMAQERFINAFEKIGIKSGPLSHYVHMNIPNYISRLTDQKKPFTIIQSLIDDSRSGILFPSFWNVNLTNISLLYNPFDHTAVKTNTEKDLCKKYWTLNINYKKGRKISGMLVTTGDIININCKKYDMPFDFLLTWYPTIPEYKFEYSEPEIKKVFYPLGGGWDLKRISAKFLGFLKNSGNKGYLDVYGPNAIGNFGESTKQTFGNTYVRYLNDTKEIIETSRKYSAILVLHSDAHFSNGIPSGRIFEALASGRLIISDMNPWVFKHIGSAALYIDTSKSQEEVEKQIENHITWIRENPELAKAKAEKSYKIFLEKYKIDYQVKNLVNVLKKLDYSDKVNKASNSKIEEFDIDFK